MAAGEPWEGWKMKRGGGGGAWLNVLLSSHESGKEKEGIDCLNGLSFSYHHTFRIQSRPTRLLEMSPIHFLHPCYVLSCVSFLICSKIGL